MKKSRERGNKSLYILIGAVILVALVLSYLWLSGFFKQPAEFPALSTSTVNQVAYYTLDSDSGSKVTDYSWDGNYAARSHNGTVLGVLGCDAAGWLNNACSFTGTSQILLNSIPIDTFASGKNTVAFWMYWDGKSNEMPISDNYSDLYFAGGCFGFNTGHSDVLGFNSSGLVNKWVYVTAVFSNAYPITNNYLYIDGVQQNLSSCTTGSPIQMQVSTSFTIGGYAASPGDYNFTGLIDELRIFNTDLTPSQAYSLFKGDCIGFGSSLAGTNDALLAADSTELCHKNRIYVCNPSSSSMIFRNFASDKAQIGSWQCDLTHSTWIPITPWFAEGPNAYNCTYGYSCGPFTIRSNISGSFNYEFKWINTLSNGTNMTYCPRLVGNADVCQVEPGQQSIYPISTGMLTDSLYSFYTSITDTSGQIVNKTRVVVAVRNGAERSEGIAMDLTINYNCTHECLSFGQARCTTVFTKQVCGNFDNDFCLEWGPETNCGTGNICSGSGACTAGGTDTCNDVNWRCVATQPVNSSHISGATCTVSSYGCYQCLTGYVWNSNGTKCLRANCNDNCTTNNGICTSSTINNAAANGSITCCDDSIQCMQCSAGYHAYNNTCVQNACSGLQPTTVNGTIIGANVSTSGPALSWAYSPRVSSVGACQWECSEGWHNESNGCAIGYGLCEDYGGICRTSALSNADIIGGNCSSGICYACKSDYTWNGSACYKCQDTCTSAGGFCSSTVLSNTDSVNAVCCSGSCYKCSSNSVYQNGVCNYVGTCSGCWYDNYNSCLPNGFRLLSSGSHIYCNATSHLFNNQKSGDGTCQSNYECQENYCISGKCISDPLNLLKEVYCNIKKVFGADEAACLAS